MQANRPSKPAQERTTWEGLARVAGILLLVGVGGLAVGVGLGLAGGDGLERFLHAYLTSYCYFLNISLGALFFVALQHVTRAGWSATVRRVAELVAANMPCLAVLFLPILVPVLFESGSLYGWADPSAKVREGFEDKMNSFQGQFTDEEIGYLIRFIQSLD